MMKATKLSQIFLIVPRLLLIPTNVSDFIIRRKHGKKEDLEDKRFIVIQSHFR